MDKCKWESGKLGQEIYTIKKIAVALSNWQFSVGHNTLSDRSDSKNDNNTNWKFVMNFLKCCKIFNYRISCNNNFAVTMTWDQKFSTKYLHPVNLTAPILKVTFSPFCHLRILKIVCKKVCCQYDRKTDQ